jgi:glycosyltransferase involved in cell wall biosynthesis
MKNRDYVLITPVRNEAQTIGTTIESIAHQTVQPREWVIVSDGSTDQTDEIVKSQAAGLPYIHYVRLENRPDRAFSSVVFAIEAGLEALRAREYGFIGILDGDIRFGGDYYAQILERFERDEKLGLAGGLVLDVLDGKHVLQAQYLRDVAGAVQLFRRECFEALGGLIAIPEGGWDAITCIVARMHGFETQTFPEILVDHLKPRNSGMGGWLRRKWIMGSRDYALGYHPLFEFFKCCSRTLEYPPVIGAITWWLSFGYATGLGRKRLLPEAVQKQVRQEQMERLREKFGLGPRDRSNGRVPVSSE